MEKFIAGDLVLLTESAISTNKDVLNIHVSKTGNKYKLTVHDFKKQKVTIAPNLTFLELRSVIKEHLP
jgi:hypothetical protein